MQTAKRNPSIAQVVNKNKRTQVRKKEAHIGEAVNELLDNGKKIANRLYKDGTKKVKHVEANIGEYASDTLKTIKQNPLASVLVAAGAGFLLSRLFKK